MAVISFNSNVAALNAQRQLSRSSAKRLLSFERLSTGLRINRASDDAAGLAVADSLRRDSRLYSQAIRNANDGVSLLSIADGTLEQQSNVVQRLIELSEQSANGTLSSSQRANLNKEYQTLLQEFGRLGDSTQFNGLPLLLGDRAGSPAPLSLQVGITGQSNSLLTVDTTESGSFSGTFDLSLVQYVPGVVNSATAEALFSAYGNLMSQTSVVDSSGQQRDLLLAFTWDGSTGVRIYAYQRVSDTGGVGATTGGGSTVTDASHEWVRASATTRSLVPGGDLDISSFEANFSFMGGATTGHLSFDLTGIDFQTTEAATTINFTGVETSARSLTGLTVLRSRLSDIGATRGEIGAAQSRLQTTLSLLAVSRENVSAAESLIRDVDVAEEAAELARSEILQNAGATILAGAIAQPQLLLSLLQG